MSGAPGSGAARQVAPSARAATWAMASLTWRRLVRGRAPWVGLVIAALPVAFTAANAGLSSATEDKQLFAFELLAGTVLAAMLIGGAIGDELERRTSAYLWSRPIPRAAVIAGKLLALAPLVVGMMISSWVVAAVVAWGAPPPLRSVGALGVGGLVISLVATGISALGPRHGTALTICYFLFFDLPLNAIPLTLQHGSVTYQIITLAGLGGSSGGGLAAASALLVIGGAWSAVTWIRVRRLEV